MTRALATILLFALSWGCASHQYKYKAMENEFTGTAGKMGAVYHFPSKQDPTGTVRVTTLGVADLGAQKEMPNIRVMHMRLEIDNRDSKNAWELNTREQLLSLPNEGKSQVAYVNTDTDSKELPQIKVEPGKRRVVDLYYPLPQGMKEASEIPNFEFHWQLQAGNRKIQETTPFDRFDITPDVAYIYPYGPYTYSYPYGFGWGTTWWYNPYYSQWTFNHPVPVHPIL